MFLIVIAALIFIPFTGYSAEAKSASGRTGTSVTAGGGKTAPVKKKHHKKHKRHHKGQGAAGSTKRAK
jgi:hypothetical protein